MSNEIIPVGEVQPPLLGLEVYDRIGDPMAAIKILGRSIFLSGIFGIEKPEQGEVIAMECLVQRKSPLELARTYHFIDGNLAIRADALLAKFMQAGGTVDWVTRNDELVEADFCRNGSKVRIVASMKEHVGNGNAMTIDKKTLQPCLKTNWKKWPRRMLTARAISEGVRLVAPDACFGTYVVEELEAQPRYNITAKTLEDLVPESHREAAVKVLHLTGHLTEGQGWGDISEDLAATLEKKPAPFLAAVAKELNFVR